MNYLKNYIKVSDLSNIVEQYLIGDAINKDNLNAKDKNKNANLLGVDLFIAKPMLKQLCLGGHNLLVKKYIKCCSFDRDIINREFLKACLNGHFKIVQFLVEYDEKLSTNVLNDGLIRACYYNQFKIVQFLIEQGANNLNKGLCFAHRYGHFKILQYLITEYGGKINTNNLNSVLIKACAGGHFKIVQSLVECEGKLNTNDFNKGLYLACAYGHFEIVQYLIECERKFNITFNIAKCIKSARINGNTKILNYLLKK